MEFLLDFILHIDQHMIEIVQEYHTWEGCSKPFGAAFF